MSALVRVLSLALVISSGCANTTAFVVTGEALDTLEGTVELVHQRMVAASAEGRVTAEQVQAFNAFLGKFQSAYPVAVQLWKAGRHVNDAAITGEASKVVAGLVAELVPLAAVVGVSLAGVVGGAP
jgi:hypothetical protein